MVPKPIAEAVFTAILETYSITPEMIRSTDRTQAVAWARHIATFIMRACWGSAQITGEDPAVWGSGVETMRMLGWGDHTIVSYGVGRVIQNLSKPANVTYRGELVQTLRRVAELVPELHRPRVLKVADAVECVPFAFGAL